MKIAIVIPSLTIGGAEKQALKYAEFFSEDELTTIYLIGLGKGNALKSKITKSNIRPIEYNLNINTSINHLNKLVSLYKFRKFLKGLNVTHVISFTYWPNIYCSFSCYFLPKVKHIWNQRSIDSDLGISKIEQIGMKSKQTAYVANSFACKDFIKNRHNLDDKTINVIYNILDHHDKPKIYDSMPPKVDLIMVANYFKGKDHHLLIKAFKMALEQNCDNLGKLYLLGNCVGNRNRINTLKALVLDLGIADRVLFLENTNPETLYGNYKIGVLATQSEGFSNTLSEYCIHSLSVIASDIPANIELLNNDYPYLFDKDSYHDLANKIINIASLDKDSINSLIQSNYTKIAKLLVNRENKIKIKRLINEN